MSARQYQPHRSYLSDKFRNPHHLHTPPQPPQSQTKSLLQAYSHTETISLPDPAAPVLHAGCPQVPSSWRERARWGIRPSAEIWSCWSICLSFVGCRQRICRCGSPSLGGWRSKGWFVRGGRLCIPSGLCSPGCWIQPRPLCGFASRYPGSKRPKFPSWLRIRLALSHRSPP